MSKLLARLTKKISLSAILIILITSITLSNSTAEVENKDYSIKVSSTNKENNDFLFNYVPHDPIIITSDNNFTDYGFLGSGNETHPYLIEGLSIITESSNGIKVEDTTKFFRIRNCYIETEGNGIFIDNTTEGTVEIIDNICNENSNDGIAIRYSNSTTITNNTCRFNDIGIYIYHSPKSSIIDNKCHDNIEDGIALKNSECSVIDDNFCENNGLGRWDEFGIYLVYSGYSVVTNNELLNNGLFVDDTPLDTRLSYDIHDNFLNGKSIGFFKNTDNILIENHDYSQLSFTNCSNIVIRNQVLEKVSFNCFLSYCDYALIENNTCETVVIYSNNSIIDNNKGIDQTSGIILDSCWNSTITNNLYKYCLGGILAIFSPESKIINNTCNDNNFGIVLTYLSNNSTIESNECNYNKESGMELEYSDFLNITKNTCNYNDECGIYLRSYHSSINYNVFKYNVEYGLNVNGKYNYIHHNSFIDNNLIGGGVQARGWSNNTWYDPLTLEGNFWSNWNGTGVYYIDGASGEFDPYPLSESLEPTTDTKETSISMLFFIASFPLIVTLTYLLKKKEVALK